MKGGGYGGHGCRVRGFVVCLWVIEFVNSGRPGMSLFSFEEATEMLVTMKSS